MTEVQAVALDPAALATLARLAARHRAANGFGMHLLGLVGGSAEGLVHRLPDSVRARLEGATRAALDQAFDAAAASRRAIPRQGDWVTTALATAMGAAGGAGGLPTALAELPVTTAVLLRAIQGIAEEHGFDPSDPSVRLDCLRVFAAAGPLAGDDDADLGFLATRLAVTGQSVQALIARVAPRLSVVLGQKLAAQAAPLIGAVAGAAINWVFTGYYQEMARVQFGLAALARDTGLPRDALAVELRAMLR